MFLFYEESIGYSKRKLCCSVFFSVRDSVVDEYDFRSITRWVIDDSLSDPELSSTKLTCPLFECNDIWEKLLFKGSADFSNDLVSYLECMFVSIKSSAMFVIIIYLVVNPSNPLSPGCLNLLVNTTLPCPKVLSCKSLTQASKFLATFG